MTNRPLRALDAAIKAAGGQRKLANLLGHKHQSYIGNMRRRVEAGAVVPAEICPEIERITAGKVKRAALNPRVSW